MLVTNDTHEVTLGNVANTGEFTMRSSPKAFAILSSGLYSNKIRAIIRELSCNALDSHVAARNLGTPFQVHLPCMLEPWFSVKDFGTGLTGEQVMGIYTTYFGSTKTDSNDYIGALGLGSKSPFSYTDNFTITAIKDGTKVIFSAFINSKGFPSVAQMGSTPTDEPNGLEIKFSVTNRGDFYKFSDEARNVFKWFNTKPEITGEDDFVIPSLDITEHNIAPGIHLRDSSSDAIAVMGNIAYPIGDVPGAKEAFGDMSLFLDCPIMIEFDIGDLDISASRESLSYIPLTVNSIKKKLEILRDSVYQYVQTAVDSIDGDWGKALYLQTKFKNLIFESAVRKYVTDTKLDTFDLTQYLGIKQYDVNVEDLAAVGIVITGFRRRRGISRSLLTVLRYNTGARVWTVPVSTGTYFVLDDLKSGALGRAKAKYGNSNLYNGDVFCVSHSSPDMTVRQAAYDQLMASLNHPINVVKASELPVVKRAPSTRQATTGYLYPSVSSSGEYVAGWYVSPPPPPKTTKIYVEVNREDIVGTMWPSIDLVCSINTLKKRGVDLLGGGQLYGVRKKNMPVVTKSAEWVHVDEQMKAAVATISDRDIWIASIYDDLQEFAQSHSNGRAVTTMALLGKLDSRYPSSTDESRKFSAIWKIVSRYDSDRANALEKDAISKFSVDRDLISTKYPLLAFISWSAPANVITEYVNLVDTQQQTA